MMMGGVLGLMQKKTYPKNPKSRSHFFYSAIIYITHALMREICKNNFVIIFRVRDTCLLTTKGILHGSH